MVGKNYHLQIAYLTACRPLILDFQKEIFDDLFKKAHETLGMVSIYAD